MDKVDRAAAKDLGVRLKHLFEAAHLAAVMETEMQERRKAFAMSRRAWRATWAEVQAIPCVLYPYEKAIIRAIREFDKNVIPLMVKRAYRAHTGEERVYHFHAIGSVRWNPEKAPAPWTRSVLMPTWNNAPYPNHMDLHLENRYVRIGDGLPGAYMPFDWGVYHGLREMYDDWTDQERVQFIEENDRAALARKARIKAEERVAERARKESAWLKERFQRIDRHDVERIKRNIYEPPKKLQVAVP